MTDSPGSDQREDNTSLAARIVALRERGASWQEIEQSEGLNRQQARYQYQIGKRAERRKRRKEGG